MFKNAIFYRIQTPLNLDPKILQAKLDKYRVKPIGKTTPKNFGWCEPNPYVQDDLALACGDSIFIRLKINTRLLPQSVINDELRERVAELENKIQKKVAKKNRAELKDEIINELMPRAFVQYSFVDAFINQDSGLICVDAASPSKAELLLSHLRVTLGSLPVVPLAAKVPVWQTLNYWIGIDKEMSSGLSMSGKYEVKTIQGETEKVAKLSGFDSNGEVRDMVNAGGMAISAGLEWRKNLSFTITDDFFIKSISDISEDDDGVIEKDEDPAHGYEANRFIVAAELTNMIVDLIMFFGEATR